ncbi:hypothetical protein C2G38_1365059 [Gigaspora rosea]|uniref:BACK domain-containing protein n=1 Tax=Gigaspora rosea TaxID=44941 RepID=A0A397V973_9GLOM|nr:hypothetical protein C2G38_1365059 [Gigaspora rosea]
MEEVNIWKRIIEWGIAQHSDIPSDPKNWSNENFLTMKATLKNCLPFIRYFQISSENVIDHLQPYRQILDNNLWDDIMKRLLFPNKPISSVILPPRVVLTQTLPPRTTEQFSTIIRTTEQFSTIIRTTEQFSTIISEAHAAEITSWIDKKI